MISLFISDAATSYALELLTFSFFISILYEQTLASDMLRSRPHPDQPVPGQEVLLPCTP